MMKTWIITLALLFTITLANVFAGTVVKVYEFSNPSILKSGEYFTIQFEGTTFFGETGKATLPFYPVKLLLPPGEVAAFVSVEFKNRVILEGEYFLLPRHVVIPVSALDDGNWMIDQEFYSGHEEYPSSFKHIVETQFYNGSGIALSAFTPVRYIPSERKIMYYQQVVITIQTVADPEISSHLQIAYPSASKTWNLKQLVQNPEETDLYQSSRDVLTNNYNYLIISQNQYLPEFETLVDFYKPRGIRTKLASTETISATVTGADLQEKIRNYIIDEYQAFGPDYVLIGGDKEIVPYRGFYCFVQSGNDQMIDYGIPADLYYSALDGSWNTDGDNMWAEPDEDDLFPEVGIGRLTFSDTVELHNMLHKIFLYQDNPVEGELTTPLLSGEYLYNDPITYGSDYMNLLVGYCTENGYSTYGIPPEHPRDTLYDDPGYTWTKAELMSRINAGRPWIHHVGHANYTYAMRFSNSDITNANFSGANGMTHNYPIVYTHGCMCGGFDYNGSDCIAERMIGIDNFAVAFVGNSRYGWFNQGTTDGPSQHLHREFMDALYYDSLFHIGMAHLKSKSETAPFVELGNEEFEPGATRWCFYDNNVLGDPMMALWTYEPYSVAASYPGLIPIGAEAVEVQVNGPEGACKGFTCSIYRNDTLFGSSYTDLTGMAMITIEEELAEGDVWLVVSGYNILPQYFVIHVSEYWLGWTNDWSDPANWYTGQVPDASTFVIIPADPAGPEFPVKNTVISRHCKAILIEPGAQFNLGPDETFYVGDD
jgi:hypothetical protein